MDLQQAKQEFATQGYVAWRGFMDPREIGQVNAELDRYIRDVFPTLPDTAGFFEDKDDPTTLMRLQSMCDYDDYFRQLYYGDRLMDIGRALLDDELVGKNKSGKSVLSVPKGCNVLPPQAVPRDAEVPGLREPSLLAAAREDESHHQQRPPDEPPP